MSRQPAKLSITDALTYGWKATNRYVGFYFTLALLILLFNFIPSVFAAFFDNSVYTPVIRGIFITLIAIVTLGMIRTTLSHADKKDASLADLFRLNLFGKYLLTSLIYLFLVVGGLILFIIPGVYWGLKYQFATYLLVDKKLSIAKSFEESAKLVQGYEWDLLSYWLVMILLNVVGILFFVIGVVVTLPITITGYTHLYRQLRK